MRASPPSALLSTPATHQGNTCIASRDSGRKRLLWPLPIPNFIPQSVPLSPRHLPTRSPNILRCSPIWYVRAITEQPEGSLSADRSRLLWFFAMSVSHIRMGPNRCQPPNLSLSWNTAGLRGEVMNSCDSEKETGLA